MPGDLVGRRLVLEDASIAFCLCGAALRPLEPMWWLKPDFGVYGEMSRLPVVNPSDRQLRAVIPHNPQRDNKDVCWLPR